MKRLFSLFFTLILLVSVSQCDLLGGDDDSSLSTKEKAAAEPILMAITDVTAFDQLVNEGMSSQQKIMAKMFQQEPTRDITLSPNGSGGYDISGTLTSPDGGSVSLSGTGSVTVNMDQATGDWTASVEQDLTQTWDATALEEGYVVNGTSKVSMTVDLLGNGSNMLDISASGTLSGNLTVSGTYSGPFNFNISVTLSDYDSATTNATLTFDGTINDNNYVKTITEPMGDDNNSGGGTATVSGTITLPADATGKEYFVGIDDDGEGGNGFAGGIVTGTVSGSSISYTVSNVNAGTFIVVAVVDMDGSHPGGGPATTGDYLGAYGADFNNPQTINVADNDNITGIDFTLFIY